MCLDEDGQGFRCYLSGIFFQTLRVWFCFNPAEGCSCCVAIGIAFLCGIDGDGVGDGEVNLIAAIRCNVGIGDSRLANSIFCFTFVGQFTICIADGRCSALLAWSRLNIGIFFLFHKEKFFPLVCLLIGGQTSFGNSKRAAPYIYFVESKFATSWRRNGFADYLAYRDTV